MINHVEHVETGRACRPAHRRHGRKYRQNFDATFVHGCKYRQNFDATFEHGRNHRQNSDGTSEHGRNHRQKFDATCDQSAQEMMKKWICITLAIAEPAKK